MSGRKVLVTGGAGFIGSHVADAYIAAGDRVWIVDNLSSGKRGNVPAAAQLVVMDIGDPQLDELFASVGGFDIVNHHAAQIDVRLSVADPRRDAAINVDGFLNVLTCAARHGVQRFLFVSSGGVVYGEPEQRPTPETAPKLPLSPYGVTKLSAEYYLYYYHRIHGLEYAAMRYSNVYGPRQDPHGEAGVVAIFSTRAMTGTPMTIFGDGAQTRDYVFVGDVVAANMLLSNVALAAAAGLDERAFNVGTSVETSVNALADQMMHSSGRQVAIERAAERKGELRHSCLEAGKLRSLGWAPATSLAEGLGQTYRFIAAQHAGQEVAS
jgi:UDP-glucose 4-epimerase